MFGPFCGLSAVSGRRGRAAALAPVRRSNRTYGFPVSGFHKGVVQYRDLMEGISDTRFTKPCPPKSGPSSHRLSNRQNTNLGSFPWLFPSFPISCPFRVFLIRVPRLATHYRRLWIQRSSSERRRDLNPPDLNTAQHTLCPLLTSAGPSGHLTAMVALREESILFLILFGQTSKLYDWRHLRDETERCT